MTEGLFGREPIDCARLRGSPLPQVYLDGELRVAETLAIIFALVSVLGREDLIECARTFLREGGQRQVGAQAEPQRNFSGVAGVVKSELQAR